VHHSLLFCASTHLCNLSSYLLQLVAVKIKKPHCNVDKAYPYYRQWVPKCRADFHALRICRDARHRHDAQPRALDLDTLQCLDVMHVFGAIISPQDLHREFEDHTQHPHDEVISPTDRSSSLKVVVLDFLAVPFAI
jgi:hypothetical protein